MQITIFQVIRDLDIPTSTPLPTVYNAVQRSLNDTAEGQRQARNLYIVRFRTNQDNNAATNEESDQASAMYQCIQEAIEHYAHTNGQEPPNIHRGELVGYEFLGSGQQAASSSQGVSGPQLNLAPLRPARLYPATSRHPAVIAVDPTSLNDPSRTAQHYVGLGNNSRRAARYSEPNRSQSFSGPLPTQYRPVSQDIVNASNPARGEVRFLVPVSSYPVFQSPPLRTSFPPTTGVPGSASASASASVPNSEAGQGQRSWPLPPGGRPFLIHHLRTHIPAMEALLRIFEAQQARADGQPSTPTVPENVHQGEARGDHARSAPTMPANTHQGEAQDDHPMSGQEHEQGMQQSGQESNPVVTETGPGMQTSHEEQRPAGGEEGDDTSV